MVYQGEEGRKKKGGGSDGVCWGGGRWTTDGEIADKALFLLLTAKTWKAHSYYFQLIFLPDWFI